MAVESTFLLALVGMALASFACRISGFLLMGYVRITPRVEAALKAIPLSVMVGIVTPAATSGKLPELLALLAVGLVMKLVRNDLAAAVAGAATVAVARWALGAGLSGRRRSGFAARSRHPWGGALFRPGS